MGNFNDAYEKMIKNEGGYKLHNVSGDRGGQTYAGISRKYHPYWPGWRYIDNGDHDNPGLTFQVRKFYKRQFWEKIRGDEIIDQSIAVALFDFAVNAGCRTAVKLAQIVLDATPDGVLGPVTLEKLNKADPVKFALMYALAKIKRYSTICNRDRGQSKFLLGWINRTFKTAEIL